MSARPGAGPVRGGHPEAREPGGGWGASVPRVAGPVASARGPEHGVTAPADSALPGPRPRQERSDQGASDQGAQGQGAPGRGAPGRGHPRQDYIDAFDAPAHAPAGAGFNAPVGNASASFEASAGTDPYARVSEWDAEPPAPPEDQDRMSAESGGGREKRGRGMTFTGIAAAAVTTVLAVVVAGQVADRDGSSAHGAQAQAAEGGRPGGGSTSRTDERPAPKKTAQAAPATYGQKMAKKYPLAADLKASGAFTTIPGTTRRRAAGRSSATASMWRRGSGSTGRCSLRRCRRP